MSIRFTVVLALLCFFVQGCAEVTAPDARNVNIPSPISAEARKQAVNERPDSVMYLPLGEDVLVPEKISGERLPDDVVGPFELRSETLAGALQLILADYDIAIAFETEAGLDRKITVANLKGGLDQVIRRICSLADLYCSYEEGALIVKDTQTFAVTLPPLATDEEGTNEFIGDVVQGLSAVVGDDVPSPVSDPTTRTLIYSATQRTAALAANYFQRLRASTAMIVFETYIWEVSLSSGNSTGIDWSSFDTFGKFNTSIGINGSVAAAFSNPISIGLPTTNAIGATPTQLVEFLSTFGAVKTISQPQITVLSGSSAELRVADTENYVSEVSSTVSGDQTTTSVSTDSVDSGFSLSIDSSWDKSTVYANVSVNLSNVLSIDDFTFSDSGATGTDTIIQLPQTTERELRTQIRVRPGDSVLIGGLVRETDNFDSRGPGFMKPILPDSRTALTSNLELVILLRPRVVVYADGQNKKYQDYIEQKAVELRASKARPEWMKSDDNAIPYLQRNNTTSAVPAAPQKITPVVDPVKKEPEVKFEAPVVSIPTVEEPVVEVKEPIEIVPKIEEPIVEIETQELEISVEPSTVPVDVQEAAPNVSVPRPQLSSPEPYVPRVSSGYETGYVSKYQKPSSVAVSEDVPTIQEVIKEVVEEPSSELLSSPTEENFISVVPVESVPEEFEAGQELFVR